MKLETYVGPMQGSTAGIIWDLLFLHVPGIGINLQRKKTKSLNEAGIFSHLDSGNSHLKK